MASTFSSAVSLNVSPRWGMFVLSQALRRSDVLFRLAGPQTEIFNLAVIKNAVGCNREERGGL
ncbi:hypothetical protein [Bradyrhizobium sp. AS23.2]|uniref:hypothetical protein n=1 Tax=Bradyrhizobium sp. AS23.2 TaxID=1680155 RepID=UPI001160F1F3|nr:hypothetical protein [Bradyrhizobium sp. AS23.2]